ncbi:AAA family ATPase [Streptomyces sp. NPDC058662]|uniref:nSTAND1 domain-containing NTPase n=1 Tax=Streptomyces sp. NPDC058662 TaxID=3346583 RepID=UPI00364DCAF7
MTAPEATGPEVRMEAYASGSGTIYLAAESQYIAGRDLHLHYWDGSHRVDRTRPGTDAGDECPYPGMSAFGLAQSAWYFGRDALRARLTARLDDCLREGGALAVVGASGAGKSSLLRAGLVPDLARGALPGSRRWPCLVLTPTAHPMDALATHLAALTDAEPDEVVRQLAAAPDTLGRRLRAALARMQADRLVVVVDQAEELFTLVADERERHRFVTALDRLARAEGPALVVYGLRADFYGQCSGYGPLREALEHRQVFVGPMDRTQLREAVLFPARAVGLHLEEGLVELLLTDLGIAVADAEEGYDPGLLPHLAHALRLTWQRRDGARLTVAGYNDTGRIHGAVAKSAEDAYHRLDGNGRTAAEVMFRRLVRIGEGVDDTRRTVPTAQLTEGLERGTAEAVLAGFTAGRLLTRRQDTVAISHEALLRGWPRLRSWVNTRRADNLLRQRIEDDAAAWAGERRDKARLYRGSLLGNARGWAERGGRDSLGPTALDFLDASVRLARRASVLVRGSVAALVVLTLLAVAGTVTAQLQSRRADDSHTVAEEQRRLAVGRSLRAQAESLRDSDPRQSLRLSLAAQRVDPTSEGRQGLLTTLQQTRFDGASPDNAVGPVDDLAVFLRGGTLLATSGGRSRTVELWDTSDAVRPQRLAVLDGLPDAGAHVSLSADGKTLAVVTGDIVGNPPVHELSLWDVTDPRHPRRLPFRPDTVRVQDAAFSPDGRTLAVVDGGAEGVADDTLTLWDVGDPASPRRLSEPTAANDAQEVRFSADGRTLVTASTGSTKDFSLDPGSVTHTSGWQLWDLGDPRRPRAVFRGAGYTAHSLTLSPTAPVMAVARGNELVLWQFTDPASPQKIAALEHPTTVTRAAFRPDGRTVVTASDGGRTHLWDITDPKQPSGPTRLSGPAAPVGFAFSGDGNHVLVADGSRSVRRWRVSPRTAPSASASLPTGGVGLAEAAVSPDGRKLAVGGFEGTVHQWDISDPARPRALPPLVNGSDPVRTLAFDRDGTTLAVGTIADATSTAGQLVLWDVSDAGRPRRRAVLPTPTGVASLAFSPRTATLAASGSELGGRTWLGIWDTSTPEPGRRYLQESLNQLLDDTEETAPVVRRHFIADTPTVFSPDGRLLALAGSLWDVSDPAAPARVRHAPLPAGDRRAPAPSLMEMDQAAFSPDGRWLAAPGLKDDHISLWPVAPELGFAPVGPMPVAKPQRIVYHPEGRLLAAAEEHGAVRIWDVSDPAAPALAATLEETAADIRFSSDGRTLVLVPGQGGDVRLWSLGELPATVTDPTALACRIAGTGLTKKEWTTAYASGVPYQDTCGK